jgi:hypothetical protein
MKRLVCLALLALTVASFFSCASKPSVTLVLLDPCPTSFRSQATYAELAVFKNKCPSQGDLVDGETSGAVFDAVRSAEDALPAPGDLSKGKYGFAVVLRDANCGVIGFGCTEADLNTIRLIRIQVQAWGATDVCQPLKGAGCQAPATCVAGRCESEAGSGQCNLTLVASGELPNVSINSPQVYGPAIAPTASGFVIGYRAQGTLDNTVQAVGVLLSDNGHLGTPSTQNLSGCVNSEPPSSDGVGLAFPFQGGDGLMWLSLQDCSSGKGAGAFFVPVQPDATLGAATPFHGPTFAALDLARTHALAAAPTAGEYTAVFHVTTTDNPPLSDTKIVELQSTSFKSGSTANNILDNPDNSDFAMVAATSQVRGVLVRDVDLAQVYLKVAAQAGVDAGSPDSGSPSPEAGGTEAGNPEAGTPTPDSGTSGNDAGPGQNGYVLPNSPWGAITAWGSRVAAIAPGSSAPSTVLQLQAASPSGSAGTATITGQFLGGDIAAQGDHLVVVGSYVGNLTLYRLDGAQAGKISTTPVSTVPLQNKVGSVSLTAFDGSHVAIATGNDRAAVVWLSALKPQQGDPIGGWALFSCQ